MHYFKISAYFLVLLLLLTGCVASYEDLPAGTVQSVTDSPILDQQTITIPIAEDSQLPESDYLVGPGDVLLVNVNGKAELSSPGLISSNNNVSGSRVDESGAIRLPLVGRVPVAGMNLSQIEASLRQVFSRYLADPWIVVEISVYKSHPLYLLGEFRDAGTFYMDRPLTLLNGLALGGGMLDTANLRSARLVRDGKIIPVDIYQLLRQGSLQQNVWLHAEDTIYVPNNKNQNVFVFGAVTKPGSVPMPNGRLSLSQALASAGLEEVGGNAAYVRIIRSLSTVHGELIVVDQNRTLRGETLPFPLTEGDIIYVPHSAIGTWNLAIKDILPSLQVISAVLQPFVSIKYLSED
ncbi:MAG: polysaccharide biosynthesis/export family protein [Desulfuromusa sp.]|nr:polysaccharide biosynthesis/export family protein [Desulfuromusa sp.]